MGADATQTLTLKVTAADAAPAITSAGDASLKVGTAGSFTVTATGSPAPKLTKSGDLPAGVTFVDNGDGTATLAGTPADGTAGSFPLTITAGNGVGTDATQTLTLTVAPASGGGGGGGGGGAAPAITSATTAPFTIGTAGSFKITTTGAPAPTLAETGVLPAGVTFSDNHDGTATLAGTAAAGTAGIYALTITADNGVGTKATQTFGLFVAPAAGSSPTPTPSPSPSPTPGANPAKPAFGTPKVSGTTVTVPVTCTGDGTCAISGSLTVVEKVRGGKVVGVIAAKTKKKTVKLGKASVTVAGGTSATLRLKLNKAGKRLLKKRHKVKVKVTVSSGGTPVLAEAVTFTKHK